MQLKLMQNSAGVQRLRCATCKSSEKLVSESARLRRSKARKIFEFREKRRDSGHGRATDRAEHCIMEFELLRETSESREQDAMASGWRVLAYPTSRDMLRLDRP